jgi:hypothetical protein
MDTNAGRISLSSVHRRLWRVEQITATESNRFAANMALRVPQTARASEQSAHRVPATRGSKQERLTVMTLYDAPTL